MPGIRLVSMQERGIAHRGPSFNEQLFAGLRSAPWWLSSVAIHVLLGLVISAAATGAPAVAEKARGVQIDPDESVPPPEDPIPPRVIEVLPPSYEPAVPADPVPNPDNSPKAETADDNPAREDKGDLDQHGSSVFDGVQGDNSTIGVGGVAGPFGGRGPGGMQDLTGRGSGIVGGDAGLDLALEWLRRHQGRNGAWDCDGYESMCEGRKCGGAGGPLYDPGVTGLSLLAFLGAGETHRTPRYGQVVKVGLKYLKSIQDAEGCFGPRTSGHFTYNHAIASMAMSEAYGMTKSLLFKTSAQNAVDFVHKCRNPYLAWRYGVRPQDNDTSVTGWMVMALKSAVMSDLAVDPEAFDGAKAWLDKVTEPEYGRAGYTQRGNGPSRPTDLLDRFPADRSESLTAVAVLTRIFCGAKKDDEMVRKGTSLCLRSLPQWDESAGTIDYYYWYYGSLAMFQVGGDAWKQWKGGLEKAVVATQHTVKGECRTGSWDAVDPWAADGGRVYSTAANALTLEVVGRYKNVFGVK